MPPADAARVTGPSRALPRGLIGLTALLLAARIATGVWEARTAPDPTDAVAWVEIARAEAESRRTGKPILYDFSAAWCRPCQIMARDVFADPRAAASIGRLFVPVRVVDRRQEEGRNRPEVERLQRAYGVEAFPTLVVAWPGSPRYESTVGYTGRDALLGWMSGAATTTRMRALGMLPDSVAVR